MNQLPNLLSTFCMMSPLKRVLFLQLCQRRRKSISSAAFRLIDDKNASKSRTIIVLASPLNCRRFLLVLELRWAWPIPTSLLLCRFKQDYLAHVIHTIASSLFLSSLLEGIRQNGDIGANSWVGILLVSPLHYQELPLRIPQA